jgi:hypothetical protein
MRAAVALLLVAGTAHARAPDPVHLALIDVTAAPPVPGELAARARTFFPDLVASRPELAATARKGARSYDVTVRIDDYQRSVGPDPQPGQSGQVLTVRVGVQILGTVQPSGAIALTGAGRGTVMAQVGARPRPRDEADARDEALREALTRAVDEAIGKLGPPPRAKKRSARPR